MKAYIVSYHDSHDYNTRIKYLESFLQYKGYETETLISDFNHIDKCLYHVERKNTTILNVPSYSKNISIARIKSYKTFAKLSARYIYEGKDANIVYLLAPPNLLIKELALMKNRIGYKFIVEIGDMWPESMPISNKIKYLGWPILYFWKMIRDFYINQADYVITECELFKERLIKNGLKVDNSRVYFCKDFTGGEKIVKGLETKQIELCYLGSINNIIDIHFIYSLVKCFADKTNVYVHVIGVGEREQELRSAIESAGGKSIFYGRMYEDDKKQEIMSKCHFAINAMKTSVFVGMTMKSLDYFSFGIPMINNICGDTWSLIEKERCGINVSLDNISERVSDILAMSDEDYFVMCNKVRLVHAKYFSISSYREQMDKILKCVDERE